MGTVVYAFPACGKTYLGMKFVGTKKFIDLESGNWHYILTDKQKKLNPEQRKGIKKRINPAWPQNYLDAIIHALNEFEFVFVSHTGAMLCAENNIKYWIVFPDYDCKQEYVQRMVERGNKKHFVENISTNYDNYISQHFNDGACVKKIVLKKGEFLEDVFKKMKII